MKRLQQTITAASLMLLVFSSCKKQATTQPVTGPINTTNKISKIEHTGDYSEIGYNTDGSIKSIATKLTMVPAQEPWLLATTEQKSKKQHLRPASLSTPIQQAL